MKLLFMIPLWQRPVITEICFMGLNRLRKVGLHEIEVLAVISEEEMKPLCDMYNIRYVMHENQPLGKKKNYGVECALKLDWDYLIELGSDDVLKNEYLTLYDWDRDLMCLQDAVWLDSKTGSARRIRDRTGKFGAGRAISRAAVEKIHPLWNAQKFNGLDGNSVFNLGKKGILGKAYESQKPLVIDIKSEVNIWPFQKVGHPYTFEESIEGLSEEEITAIKCLAQDNISAGLTGG